MKRNMIVMPILSWLVLMFVTSSDLIAQNTAVKWYAFDAGFGVPSSSNTAVKSVVGQTLIGSTQLANNFVESGFLASPLLRGVLVSAGEEEQLPVEFALSQNFPNPFNPSTTIMYALPSQSHVVLTVYNLLGQKVVQLVDEMQEAGVRSLVWNGQTATGSQVSSGVYLYRLDAMSDASGSRFTQVRKMMVLK